MTTTDALRDPLASSFAGLLRGPLTELYAVLWRVGVLDVVVRDQAPRRVSVGATRGELRVAADPNADPDFSASETDAPSQPSRRRQRATG